MQIDGSIFLLTILPVISTTILVHEVGHAIFGWAAGYDIHALGVGLGNRPWVLRLGRLHVYVGFRHLFVGVTFSHHPQLFAGRLRASLIYAGGALANAAAACVLWRIARWSFPRKMEPWLRAIRVVRALESLWRKEVQ